MSSDAEVDAVIESWRPLGEPIPPNPATEEMVGDRHDAKPPPPMRIHPPWRAMAQEILRAKNPRLYRALKKEGKLGDYLDGQAFRARQAYDDLVDRMLQRHPADQTWVLMSAQEIIVRDILDPTT